jgi:hypothetical protein
MRRPRARDLRLASPGIGVLAASAVVMGILIVLSSGSPDASAALVLTPILIVVSLPFLARRAHLENDRTLFWLLVGALILKLAGAFVRYYVAFDIYEGVADAVGYHGDGSRIADNFRAGEFDTGLDSLSGTDFIRFFTAIVYTGIGSTMLGGFLMYSWLGFWGLYGFYRAFRIAVPEGRARSYAHLVFFLPSLLFWPSGIGKEAWMLFALGIAAVGVARILTGRLWRGLLVTSAGLLLCAQVRPHVAGLIGLALVAGYLIRRGPVRQRPSIPVAKLAGVAMLAVLALLLVQRTDEFLREKNFDTEEGVSGILEQTTDLTGQKGSTFAPSILESPVHAPAAAATILFRPFVIEAQNPQMLVASIETTFILLLVAFRFRWVMAAVLSARRQPYVAFVIVYMGLFIVAFSGVANFGILARERVQMLPFLLVLLAIPPRIRSDEEADEAERPRETVAVRA